ncbi:MAG: LacI family DNA-binding transcriptional regulator [Christensenellales bacterium]
MKKGRVTLKDIAEKAGVSVMAASLVINNKGAISQATRERVLAIAKEMQYRPNAIAKSLRIKTTNTIGIITSDSSDYVFSKVLLGAGDAAAKAEYSVIIANTNQRPENEKKALNTMLEHRIDGLLFIAPLRTRKEDLQTLKMLGVPTVILMRSGKAGEIDSVSTDNFRGGYEIVDYLLNARGGDLRFISVSEDRQIGFERMAGYREAMFKHGRVWDDSLVSYCEPFIESGLKSTQALIKSGFRRGTICCSADVLAIGAMKAVRDAGLCVPDDICIAGFDDIELSEHLSVALTTMRQPKYEIGYEGMQLLLERMRDSNMPVKQILLPSQLIIRESA